MRVLVVLIGLGVAQASVRAQCTAVTSTQEMLRIRQDSKLYIARLEDPMRASYQKPAEVVKALEIKPGEVIADIGSGSGYFTLPLARAVGGTGRVYGVDFSPDMIRHLNRRIRDQNVTNVVTVLCAADDPLLGGGSVDRFFICDTWHQIEGRPRYLGLLKKMLRPGGEVIMVDWKKAKAPVGPPIELRVARDDVVQEMGANGFRLAAEHTFLEHQYFLVFKLKSD